MYWDDIYDDFIASELITGLPEGQRTSATATIPAPPTFDSPYTFPEQHTYTPYSPAAIPQPTITDIPPTGLLQSPDIYSQISDPSTGLPYIGIGAVGTGGLMQQFGIMRGLMTSRKLATPVLAQAFKALKRMPGGSSIKGGLIFAGGALGLSAIADAMFDGDEEGLESFLDAFDSDFASGNILWGSYRRGDNAGEPIAPNYLILDLNQGRGWIADQYISKKFVAAVRKNERTPRYTSPPKPRGRSRR